MKDELRLDLVKHHVTDVLAWLALPDWNSGAPHIARASAWHLRLLLNISVKEIEERQRKLGIEERERV